MERIKEVIDSESNTGSKASRGSVIMLAWPETRVTRTGAWYDPISKLIGLIKNNTYKVGHAAFCLVDYDLEKAFYFDFGRYQSPQGYGRARSVQTDPELAIDVKPIVESGRIQNLDKILTEIKQNPSCHGDGYLIGAVRDNVKIDSVYKYIDRIQSKDYVKYAPFKPASTNCSRFASRAFLKPGFDSSFSKFINLISLYQFNVPLKQITQKSHRDFVHVVDDNDQYHKMTRTEFMQMKPNLRLDEIPNNGYSNVKIKEEYHELKGLGAHAYYKINPLENGNYLISRYDDHNFKHFEFEYRSESGVFDIDRPFNLTYPSHARVVSIMQDGVVVRLVRV